MERLQEEKNGFSGNNSPWKKMYERMGMECPQNDAERHILEMLGEGQDLSDCLEYWKAGGMNEESFLEFMEKADKWEAEELQGPDQKQKS